MDKKFLEMANHVVSRYLAWHASAEHTDVLRNIVIEALSSIAKEHEAIGYNKAIDDVMIVMKNSDLTKYVNELKGHRG